jgi:DNA-binding beta-propeller fold protein YncE
MLSLMKIKMSIKSVLNSLILTTAFGCFCTLAGGAKAQAQGLPNYKVDPNWPKQLPNNWIIGQIGGLTVDKDDHIWVFHRPRSLTVDEAGAAQTPPITKCCIPAPSVLEFDTDGNLLKSWGGTGYVPNWPASEHGILVDKAGNVWLTGNGHPVARGANAAPEDREVLKFTNDGKLLMEIGHPAVGPDNNQDTGMLGSPAGMEIDEAAHELYVADGYGNRRIVVYDTETGAFKRGWGAYGIPLSDIDNGEIPVYNPANPPAKQFLGPVHCVHISTEGLVYICDRTANRIQVFTKQGKFVKEFFVEPQTLRGGSIWTLNFSHDPQQKYLIVGDGGNNFVWILNRDDGKVMGSFGHPGRNAGQFHWLHQAGMDSQGNLYTGEVDTGKRIQKFILQK